MMLSRLSLSVCLAACSAIVLPLALAQSAVDGAIGGTVEDQSGATVPGAAVTVRSHGTNAEQNVTSDGSGVFRVLHLQPGVYTVSAAAQNFGSYESTDVVVQVGELTNVAASLPIGGTATTVEVSSDLPTINTSSPDFANVIDLRILGNLPVNNYRWSSYALLTPGVVSDSNGFGLLSFRGQSTLQNNISVDGADDNQGFFAEERGRTRAGYTTAQSSIQEFQVNTSNYTVEYGRAVGGVVNSITKSGTNSFHGDLYFRRRDNEFSARNAFTTITVQDPTTKLFAPRSFRPKDWRNQYGGGVGGPLFRDKLFFFVAIDKYKRNFPGTAIASNPTSFFANPDATLPAGIVCGGSKSTAPSSIDAAVCTLAQNLNYNTSANPKAPPASAQQYAAAQPRYVSGIASLNTLLGPVPRTGDQNILFPKVDWQINEKNHVAFEVNRLNWNSPAGIQTGATTTNGRRTFGDDFVKLTFGIAKLDTTLTPSLVNQVRYQYGRDFEFENAQTPTSDYEQQNLLAANTANPAGNPFGIPPSVSISNAFSFGTPTFLQRARYPDERRWQIADTANYTRGHHNLKFGLDLLHTDDSSSNLRFQFGGFSYSSVANYLSDLYLGQNAATVSQAKHYRTYQQAFGLVAFEFTTKDYGFFLQDEWKVLPRLTLMLGARYDFEQLPTPHAPLINPDIPQTASFHSAKKNIAPRVGFAWDVYGTGKTSVRGGVGVFYGRIINSSIYNALIATGNLSPTSPTNTSPVSQAIFAYTPTTPGAPTFPQIVPTAPTATAAPAAVYFDRNFSNPYVYQADLAIQQDLGHRTTLGISYLGALGRALPQFVDSNLPTANNVVSYTVIDTTGKGPLRPGSTYQTKFYSKDSRPTTVCLSQRPNCKYGSITRVYSGVNTSYHALVAQVSHQLTNGLSIDANYTFSHALDFGGNNSTFTDTNDLLDPANPRGEYGNSNQNVPNRFVVFAVYQTPSKFTGPLKLLLNDYEISPSFSAQSGLPYTAQTNGGLSFVPSATNGFGPNLNGFGDGVNGSGGSTRIDILGRNQFRQPRTGVLDLRLSKRFAVREGSNFEILVESFNLLNHQNVTNVNQTAYNINASATPGTATTNTLTFNTNQSNAALPLFGATTNSNNNLVYSPRQVQLGARFHF